MEKLQTYPKFILPRFSTKMSRLDPESERINSASLKTIRFPFFSPENHKPKPGFPESEPIYVIAGLEDFCLKFPINKYLSYIVNIPCYFQNIPFVNLDSSFLIANVTVTLTVPVIDV